VGASSKRRHPLGLLLIGDLARSQAGGLDQQEVQQLCGAACLMLIDRNPQPHHQLTTSFARQASLQAPTAIEAEAVETPRSIDCAAAGLVRGGRGWAPGRALVRPTTRPNRCCATPAHKRPLASRRTCGPSGAGQETPSIFPVAAHSTPAQRRSGAARRPGPGRLRAADLRRAIALVPQQQLRVLRNGGEAYRSDGSATHASRCAQAARLGQMPLTSSKPCRVGYAPGVEERRQQFPGGPNCWLAIARACSAQPRPVAAASMRPPAPSDLLNSEQAVQQGPGGQAMAGPAPCWLNCQSHSPPLQGSRPQNLVARAGASIEQGRPHQLMPATGRLPFTLCNRTADRVAGRRPGGRNVHSPRLLLALTNPASSRRCSPFEGKRIRPSTPLPDDVEGTGAWHAGARCPVAFPRRHPSRCWLGGSRWRSSSTNALRASRRFPKAAEWRAEGLFQHPF